MGRFRSAGAAALFLALTLVMTWPQALALGTRGAAHQDVYFNLWRLRWIAHALATSPLSLFDGNQFHPERGVLAYSDAMLVEGLLGAPLLWMRVPPVLVHNLLLLGAIAASAVGMFVLARHLTRNAGAAAIAGAIFAFAPYRFEHYMHMELQWALWSPWAFWALQRTIETGSWRFGLATGAFVALQMLSSIYYGIFLGMLLPIVAAVQLIALPPAHVRATLRTLVAGALVAAAVSWMYSAPYTAAASRVGTRDRSEIAAYSAKPRHYAAATESNLLYGARSPGTPERRLFPGLLPLLLALAGLLLVQPSAAVVSYLIGGVLAFELSLGLYGQLYPWLYDHVGALHGLRAPARASIFVLLFLGVLAAHGLSAVMAALPVRVRPAVAAVALAVVLLEYWTAPLRLVPYPNTAPPLYAWLSSQPRGVVLEVPAPAPDTLPGEDARYAYMSTFHWMPIANGYSGYYPASYLRRLERLRRFPDRATLASLQAEDVRYLIVHADGYAPGEYVRIRDALHASGVPLAGEFFDGRGAASVFTLGQWAPRADVLLR